MSMRRPTAGDIAGPGLLAILTGFYDAITRLNARTSVESLITVTLAAGGVDNRVLHGLPGVVATWEVVDTNAAADVWRSPTVNPDPSVILLRASATATVKLRFT